jgi:hypothetical protein
MPLGTSETKPLKFTQDQGRQLPSSRGAMSAARTLLSGFIRSAAADGTAAALWLDGQTTTYGELAAHAAQLAHQLESETRDEATPAVTAAPSRSTQVFSPPCRGATPTSRSTRVSRPTDAGIC